MRVLVTGGYGQLGHAVVVMLAHHELMLTDTDNMDITNPGQIKKVFTEFQPEVLVHGAAYTAVDGCEQHPEVAEAVNVRGTWNLVDACRKTGVEMVFVSTDYVFDGTKKGPYRPNDPVNPVSVYGRSKLEGEEAVATLPKFCIIRTSWVYGEGHNFIGTIIKAASDNPEVEVRVVADQFGRPTWAMDLAHAIANAIDREAPNRIFNVTGDGKAVSWYDLAVEAFKIKGITTPVVPITTAQYLEGRAGQVTAPRPANSVLDLTDTKTARIYTTDWEESLPKYLS